MAVRITSITKGTTVTIRAEGRLDAAAVPDLLAECRAANGLLGLDLSGLLSADHDGVEALRSLVREGAEVRGASPFIRQLLFGQTQ